MNKPRPGDRFTHTLYDPSLIESARHQPAYWLCEERTVTSVYKRGARVITDGGEWDWFVWSGEDLFCIWRGVNGGWVGFQASITRFVKVNCTDIDLAGMFAERFVGD